MFFTKRHLEVVITWADNGGWIVYIGESRRVYTTLKAMVRDLEDYFGAPETSDVALGALARGVLDNSPVEQWIDDRPATTGGDCDV